MVFFQEAIAGIPFRQPVKRRQRAYYPVGGNFHTVKPTNRLPHACCDLGFPPSPAFSRTDDGARDAARTAALYATTTLSPCE